LTSVSSDRACSGAQVFPGKAVARIGSTLALPIGPRSANISFELGLEGFFESSIPSQSEFSGGRGEAFYFSPAEGSIRVAISATISGSLALAEANPSGKFGPNEVPFRRN
jgi:hypothetical protein